MSQEIKKDQYLINTNDVPNEVKDTVKGKLGVDSKIYSPKENASYKGKIVYADDKFVVQSVGEQGKTAIVHPREKLELVGDSLNQRAASNDLVERNIQVHYKDMDSPAKTFPWNAEKDKEKREAAQEAKKLNEVKALTVQEVKSAAQDYAKDNIKNAKQREAFLKHLDNATAGITAQKTQQQGQKQQQPKEPQKDMER